MGEFQLTSTFDCREDSGTEQVKALLRTSAQYFGLAEVSVRFPANQWGRSAEGETLAADPRYYIHRVCDSRVGGAV